MTAQERAATALKNKLHIALMKIGMKQAVDSEDQTRLLEVFSAKLESLETKLSDKNDLFKNLITDRTSLVTAIGTLSDRMEKVGPFNYKMQDGKYFKVRRPNPRDMIWIDEEQSMSNVSSGTGPITRKKGEETGTGKFKVSQKLRVPMEEQYVEISKEVYDANVFQRNELQKQLVEKRAKLTDMNKQYEHLLTSWENTPFNWNRVAATRTAERKNKDGSVSTVLMAQSDNYAYPTLFPKDPKNQTDKPEDWIEYDIKDPKQRDMAIETAKIRGELYKFGSEKEAMNFAEGDWKTDRNGKIDTEFLISTLKEQIATQEIFLDMYQFHKGKNWDGIKWSEEKQRYMPIRWDGKTAQANAAMEKSVYNMMFDPQPHMFKLDDSAKKEANDYMDSYLKQYDSSVNKVWYTETRELSPFSQAAFGARPRTTTSLISDNPLDENYDRSVFEDFDNLPDFTGKFMNVPGTKRTFSRSQKSSKGTTFTQYAQPGKGPKTSLNKISQKDPIQSGIQLGNRAFTSRNQLMKNQTQNPGGLRSRFDVMKNLIK